MSLTIPQSICASLTLAALLAAPAARAQDILEQTRRQNAIAAQKLEADQREAMIEAYKVGKKDPKAAADILRPVLVRIEEDRSLSEARRAQLIRAFKLRIRDYEAGPAAPPTPVGSDEKKFTDEERQATIQRDQERGADIQRTMARIAELRRLGKFVEAAQLADELSRKYGNGPATTITGRTTRTADSLRTLQSIRNERDQRYVAAMRELVRSSMPVVGDIEFPPREKWLELTKRRQKAQNSLTEREQALLKALNAPITFSVQDKPFQEVLNALEKATGLVFQVDKVALDSLMIRYDTPVTLDVQNTSTRAALKKMLGDIGLTFIIKNETIKITTPELAAREMTTRTYYVGDLITLSNFTIDPTFNQLQIIQNISGLIAFIQSIDPQTWNTGGGQGTIVFNPQSMSIIIRQSAEMHFVLMGGLR